MLHQDQRPSRHGRRVEVITFLSNSTTLNFLHHELLRSIELFSDRSDSDECLIAPRNRFEASALDMREAGASWLRAFQSSQP